jgi:hypothetical protein
MSSQLSRVVLAGAVVLLSALGTVDSLSGQQPGEEIEIYRREVFSYPGSGRPDPFRSLLKGGDMGVRLEDLMLQGVVHHEDPSQSVAVLVQKGNPRRIQAKVGERIGTIRIVSISRDRVNVAVEELGVVRRETLVIDQTGESR